MSSASAYRVAVRRNLVAEIREIEARRSGEIHTDPLAVSSQLAQANLDNGCLDGDYDFAEFETARHFAALCSGYLQRLCERSIESLNTLDPPPDGVWRNPFIPRRD